MLGERAHAYTETLEERRSDVGRLILTSQPHVDPIAILYSPAMIERGALRQRSFASSGTTNS
jgi:hypothetical protein